MIFPEFFQGFIKFYPTLLAEAALRPHHSGPAPWFLGPGSAHPDLAGAKLAHVGDCLTSTGGGVDGGDRSRLWVGGDIL